METKLHVKDTHHDTHILNTDYDVWKDEKWLAYRRNWDAYPEQMHVSNFPLNLDIIVTERCNLKCVMCGRTTGILNLGITKKTDLFDFELFKKIMDEAAVEGVCAVHLTADGEPLMHRKLVDMIQYACDKGIIDVFMHSNGMLMSKEMAQKVLNTPVRRVIFSMDSPVKETYEQIRYGANYERVLNNIKNFMKLKREMGKKYPIVRVNMVLMKENYEQKQLYEEIFSSVVDEIGFSKYVNYFGADTEDRSIVPPEKPQNFDNMEFREDFVCPYPWRRLTIGVDGSVYACIPMPDTLVVGNAQEQTIKEIWHGEKLNALRRLYAEKNAKCLKSICTCWRGFKPKSNGSKKSRSA